MGMEMGMETEMELEMEMEMKLEMEMGMEVEIEVGMEMAMEIEMEMGIEILYVSSKQSWYLGQHIVRHVFLKVLPFSRKTHRFKQHSWCSVLPTRSAYRILFMYC